jgi:hypothetical protein
LMVERLARRSRHGRYRLGVERLIEAQAPPRTR